MLLCNNWRSIRYFDAEEARIYAASAKRKRVCAIKYTLRYTLVCVDGSAYIRDISEVKARMQTRVCWSKGYEISDLFCCVSAIWSVLISIYWWCLFVLKSMKGSSVKIWWNVACKCCSIEGVGSSVKIDETWSKVVLRVVAFSQGVVAPFQERLVNERR